MNEEILLTRKSPEVQGIIRVNFTETMHCRGGGLQGTTRDDMECAIEEACRAQVAKVVEWLESFSFDDEISGDSYRMITKYDWQALRAAAGMEGGE